MRLFIAARPDAASIDELQRMQDLLCKENPDGRKVSAENLHMTLAFLGEIDDPQMIEKIVSWIRTSGFQRQSLLVKEYECWRNLIVLRLENSRCFEEYVSSLRDFLAEHEIRFDGKPFRPHITLLKKAGRLPDSNDFTGDARIVFEAAALFESKTVSGRLIYTEIS